MYQKWQSWCMVLEISSATDRTFCHFELFFALWPLPPRKSKFRNNEKQSWRYYHFTLEYHKWKSYDAWFLRYGVQQTEFFLILDHFLHFYPSTPPPSLTTQRIKILKTWKKTPRDFIILHKCTINDNHMTYGSWDINCNRQIFLPPPP